MEPGIVDFDYVKQRQSGANPAPGEYQPPPPLDHVHDFASADRLDQQKGLSAIISKGSRLLPTIAPATLLEWEGTLGFMSRWSKKQKLNGTELQVGSRSHNGGPSGSLNTRRFRAHFTV
jgi:hypothetical protein